MAKVKKLKKKNKPVRKKQVGGKTNKMKRKKTSPAVKAKKKTVAKKPLKTKRRVAKKTVKKKAKVVRKRPTKRAKPKKKTGANRKEIKQKKFDQVEDLLYRGKQRGFVTEDEILHIIPDAEKEIDRLEELYERLEKQNIRVASSDEMIKMETDKISNDLEKEKTARRKRNGKNMALWLHRKTLHQIWCKCICARLDGLIF